MQLRSDWAAPAVPSEIPASDVQDIFCAALPTIRKRQNSTLRMDLAPEYKQMVPAVSENGQHILAIASCATCSLWRGQVADVPNP